MKKVLMSLFVLLISVSVFAEKPTVQVIEEKGKVDNLTIEFIKALDEARFIYTCPASLFEKGSVMQKINERASFFTREQGYYFYKRINEDVTRFDNINNIATYTATIKFQ